MARSKMTPSQLATLRLLQQANLRKFRAKIKSGADPNSNPILLSNNPSS
ncbi:unnamed protein product, partial [Rotaria sp. Silwood2]